MKDRFARSVLLWAGVIGIAELLPLYVGEALVNRVSPPSLTHPGFYYGFVGVALAWQVAFVIMSRDPERYLPLFPALLLEKLLYPVSTSVLFAGGRASRLELAGACGDFIWLALFVTVWRRMDRSPRLPVTIQSAEAEPGHRTDELHRGPAQRNRGK
jgi:hypothetical protein